MAELDEFQRIARFFAPLAGPGALGLTDDVAIIPGPPGEDYVLTADAIVEGVHYLSDDPPALVAQKLLRVNLSDLAAKGATPVGYLLTTALPPTHGEDWLDAFAAGLAEDQARFAVPLLGGDSVATPGPPTLSVAMLGRVPAGGAILRRGALPGDTLYVTGTLGDGALGLALLQGRLAGATAEEGAFLVQRYRLPEPRLALGRGLRGTAHAMLDISDGLVADAGHLAAASAVAIIIDADRLPLSAAAHAAIAGDPARRQAALSGGDDYELLFAAPAAPDMPATAIGRIEAGSGVRVEDGAGRPIALGQGGYRHF